MSQYDIIIVGSGFAGSVLAERFANVGKKVLILEKRTHIGGNMYDYVDENDVRVHQYGPHLFHTNHQVVIDYLSQFTDWFKYEHRVLGYVENKFVPIPFNLKSIEMCFDAEKAETIKEKLISTFGMEKKVPIIELRKNSDPDLLFLAEFVFEHVFKHYTMKQWGLTIDELDPEVTNRVPVYVSYDDRYFQDAFQNMPLNGYTSIFDKMLNHPSIEVKLNVDARDFLKLNHEDKTILFEGEVFNGIVIYTGAVDELLNEKFGELPYRSEEFELKSVENMYQSVGTVNYPTPEKLHAYTRITEYKHMMEVMPVNSTIAVEYPYPYARNAKKGNIPYYPIFTNENHSKYLKYVDELKNFPNFHLVGRLAEYKYYNMDAVIYKALNLFDEINH